MAVYHLNLYFIFVMIPSWYISNVVCNDTKSEYEETINSCLDRLSPSVEELSYYKRLKHTKDVQPIMFETLQECFRHEYFTPPAKRKIEDKVSVRKIAVAASELATELVHTNILIKVLHIEIIPFTRAQHTVSEDINLTALNNFSRLQELWITQQNEQYNRRFYIHWSSSNPNNELPLKRLHINMPLKFNNLNFFSMLQNLTLLDLEGSALMCPYNFAPGYIRSILESIPVEKLEVLSLSGIQRDYGTCDNIFSEESSPLLNATRLVYLNISNNYLRTEFVELLPYLNNLKIFDCSRNGINYLPYLTVLVLLQNMMVCKAGPQQLNVMYKRDVKSETAWAKPSSFAPIHCDCESKKCEINKDLNLFDKKKICRKIICSIMRQREYKENKIFELCMNFDMNKIIPYNYLQEARIPFCPSLIDIDLSSTVSNSLDYTTLPHRNFTFTQNRLTNLNLSYNSKLLSTFTFEESFNTVHIGGLESLKVLDLSFNHVRFSEVTIFRSIPNLSKLILSGNYVTKNFLQNLCSVTPNLEILRIAHAELTGFNWMMVNGCKLLWFLDLSWNKIKVLNGSLLEFSPLNVLLLNNNLIAYLDEKFARSLKKRNKEIFIDLASNVFFCGCNKSALKTVQLLQVSREFFINHHTLTCLGSEGEILIRKLNVDDVYDQCYPPYWKYITIAVAIFIVILALLAALWRAYRMRYRIKVHYFRFKHRGREVDTNFLYDSFVCYGSGDAEWVEDMLLNELENERKFHLCIHRRDFPANGSLANTIISYMGKSRTFIVVLSQSFLDRHWCLYELQQAQKYCVEQRKSLIIIKKGNICTKIPLVVEMLHSNIYIEWPEVKNNRENQEVEYERQRRKDIVQFWNKVSKCLYKGIATGAATRNSLEQNHGPGNSSSDEIALLSGIRNVNDGQ